MMYTPLAPWPSPTPPSAPQAPTVLYSSLVQHSAPTLCSCRPSALLYSCSTLRQRCHFSHVAEGWSLWVQVAAAPKLERLGLNGNTISAAVTPQPLKLWPSTIMLWAGAHLLLAADFCWFWCVGSGD